MKAHKGQGSKRCAHARRHGPGKWQAITNDPDPAIGGALYRRSNVDLKVGVCVRTCQAAVPHVADLRRSFDRQPAAGSSRSPACCRRSALVLQEVTSSNTGHLQPLQHDPDTLGAQRLHESTAAVMQLPPFSLRPAVV